MKTLSPLKQLLGPALALGFVVSSFSGKAVPYASQVVRDGNTVSFVLNQNAASVEVFRDGGNRLVLGTNAGVHTFDMTGFTRYEIKVTGNEPPGWKQYIPDGPDRNFWYPTSAAINRNPQSTNFGKVYIVNNWNGSGQTGAGRTTPDGIYVLRADGVALSGPHTGGVDWLIDSTAYSAPFKCNLGKDDDLLYVTSFYNDLAYGFNEDLSVATLLIDGSNKTPNQYVESIWVEGSQAAGNRKIYLVDGNYYGGSPGRKGLIMYDLGANAMATPGDIGTQVIGPDFYAFYPRDVARDSSGNWYLNQYRASAGQAPAISKFDGSLPWPINTSLWDSGNTYTYTMGLDINEAGGTVATASVAAGTGNVWFFDMATGAFVEEFDCGSRSRDVAFDAAGNLLTLDNSLEYARFWSPGGYTIATTSFDGTKSAFSLVRPQTQVSVTASDPEAAEGGANAGTFTVTRVGDTSSALTVNYTLSGTAVNGSDYALLSGSVVIPAGASSADVVINPTDDAEAEFTETVILTVEASPDYSAVPPVSATVIISDNETPAIDITTVLGSTMYERIAADYARLRLVRRGDTNAPSFNVNLTYSGTAAPARYTAPASVTIDPGVVNQNFDINPVDDALLNGDQTIVATVAPGTGYVVGTNSPSATATIVDDELPPEDVIWAEDFNTDNSANWTVRFGSANGIDDYRYVFSYDYTSWGWIPMSIPPAPHSTSDTLGCYLTVNKDDSTALGAAGINIYPNGQSFSGNYAVRFDMFLVVGNAASTTEYALMGINHSGNNTNWFRNSSGGVPAGWTFDGLFFGVEADAAALGDYVIYSAPTTAGNNPTALTPGRNASTLTGVFKAPPFGYAGAPSNSEITSTPVWADVEISHVNGVVTLTINRTPILSYTNATPFTSGNIMLGYCDAYDSIMAGNSGVIYDNLRVVRLPTTSPPNITNIRIAGGNVEISFTAEAGDQPSAFGLQEAATVNGPYNDVTATITGSNGNFKAVRALGGAQQFYRLKRS